MSQRNVAYSDLVVEIPGLWTNPRTFSALDKKSIDNLAADIKLRNLIDPLRVQRVRVPGRDEVIELVTDGQRRHLALPKAGIKKDDPIVVVDMSDDIIELTPKTVAQLILDIMAVGTFREGISSFEQSAAAEQVKAAGKSLGEIARAIGRSDAWVSLMLKARKHATPALLEEWRLGKITDEQFKDLAELKAPAEQKKALAETIEIREAAPSNGMNGHSVHRNAKAEARAHTRELAAKAREEAKQAKLSERAEKLSAKEAAKAAKNPKKAAKAVPAKKPERTAPSKALLQELVDLGTKRAVIADYMKGLMHGVQYALGQIDPEDFGKPWRVFMTKIQDTSFTLPEPKAKRKGKRK